ncbi:MAG: hypothetical protein WEC73_01085 [Chthoniobacterales bacterium]
MRIRRPTEWFFLFQCMACWALTALPASGAPRVSLDLVAKGPYQTGQPVEIIYRFEGVGAVDVPSTIAAGALVFRYVGSQLLPGLSKGEVRPDHGRLYIYEAVAETPGKFVVPKREWPAGGKTIRSPARTIEVRGARLASAAPQAPRESSKKAMPAGSDTDRLKWLQGRAASAAAPAPAAVPAAASQTSAPARVTPPASASTKSPAGAAVVDAGAPSVASTNVYLGQAVPVTWEFFLRADRTFQDLLRPSLAGSGFFSDAVEELDPATVTNNGVPYYRVTLQTTVVPLRTGPLEIPALTLQGRHTTDQPDGRSPTAGWTNFSRASDPLPLEVAPLPADRPEDFTGGVGQFQALAPQVDPLVAAAGEPVTLRLGVEGRGNLRAMQKPVLDPASAAGWRVYDAGETVERSAADGSGIKYFEFQLIPVQDQKASPGGTLSYFDPEEKKFVRLQFPPEPLSAAAGPAAAVASSPSPVPEGPRALPPAAPGVARSFDPVVASPWFRVLQVLIAILFLGWILWFLARRRAGRGPAARRARLRAEYHEAQAIFRAAPPGRRAFYDAAAQVIVAHLGVLHGKEVDRTAAGGALERLVPNLAQREELAAILDRSDELNYGAVESGALDADERADVARVLEAIDDRES